MSNKPHPYNDTTLQGFINTEKDFFPIILSNFSLHSSFSLLITHGNHFSFPSRAPPLSGCYIMLFDPWKTLSHNFVFIWAECASHSTWKMCRSLVSRFYVNDVNTKKWHDFSHVRSVKKVPNIVGSEELEMRWSRRRGRRWLHVHTINKLSVHVSCGTFWFLRRWV